MLRTFSALAAALLAAAPAPAQSNTIPGTDVGYAVRRVKGASVAVRVLWNPSFWSLGSDPAENNLKFERWSQDWRRTVVETFLQRGEN